jgi:P-type conjugative transfer protein TrbJ
MRRLTATVLALSLALPAGDPKPARADIFGGDVAELAAILAELLTQGATLYNQLSQLKSQVENTRQTLQTLKDVSSFRDAIGFYNTARYNYDSLIYDVNAIRYNAQTVNNDFRRLFPKNQSSWRNVPSSQFGSRYEAWNEELTSSALIAARAQTQMMRVQDMNAAAERALRISQVEAGEVRQLQAMNQMLSVMQSQLSTVVQLLSTGSRVTSDMAAATAGKDMLLQEKKRRRRDGYKNPGKPAKVLTRFP